jgi:hypothetical protein
MPTKTTEPDGDAMMRAFDAPADDWHGAGYNIRTKLAPDRSRPRRNFDAGSVTDEWDVTTPRVPSPETDAPLPTIKDRGGMGFSGTIDFGILGRPQKPGKP